MSLPTGATVLSELLADLPNTTPEVRAEIAPQLLRALGLTRRCAECREPLPTGRDTYCSPLCRNAADPHDTHDHLTDEESV